MGHGPYFAAERCPRCRAGSLFTDKQKRMARCGDCLAGNVVELRPKPHHAGVVVRCCGNEFGGRHTFECPTCKTVHRVEAA